MFYMVFLATAGHLKRKIKETLLVAEAGRSCLLRHSGVHTLLSLRPGMAVEVVSALMSF